MKPYDTNDKPMRGAWIMEQLDRPDKMGANTIALARLLAWSLAALSLTLVLVSLVLTWRAAQQWQFTHLVFAPVTAVAYALVGGLIASRHPRNPIGWIFSAEGALAGLIALTSTYELVGQSMLPGFQIARWLGLWIWIPATILPLTFVLLLFPDGHLPSPRWSPVAWSAGLGLAAYTRSVAPPAVDRTDRASKSVWHP